MKTPSEIQATLQIGKSYRLVTSPEKGDGTAITFERGKAVPVSLAQAEHLAEQFAERQVTVQPKVFEISKHRRFSFTGWTPPVHEVTTRHVDNRSAADRASDIIEIDA